MVGKNLSHYKILEELGRGGMGIVYKGEDTKLHRTVAIKVLPAAALSSDDDRARFYREARAAASLSHPNIATVYEIDEAVPEGSNTDDIRPFIAMEFIEGYTLEDRIKQGPMKLEEAVRIASEIASALEAAHENDIVHRDIKAANVMLTAKGSAKVLDFGLAQTAQSTKLTRMGSTLGTVAYMSPEQARGEEVDARTDIWAVGVTIYEMCSGQNPFGGDYEQAVVYNILNENPPALTAIRTGFPMGLEWIISKCLAKKADDRYQRAEDLIVDLRTVDLTMSGISRKQGTVSGARPIQAATGNVIREPKPSVLSATKAAWPVLAVASIVTFGLGYLAFSESTVPLDPAHYSLVLTPNEEIGRIGTYHRLRASPDGRTIAYQGDGGRIFVRERNGRSSYVITPETELAREPFFSPDGRQLGYYDSISRELKRIALPDGTPQTIASVERDCCRGITWGPNNSIVYSFFDSGLIEQPMDGGTAKRLTKLDSLNGERTHRFPHFIEGTNDILFTIGSARGSSWNESSIAKYSGASGTYSTILTGGRDARYIPTGHIVYGEGGSLKASLFDLKKGSVGNPVRLPQSVAMSAINGQVDYSVDKNGRLVFLDGGEIEEHTRVEWYDRGGKLVSVEDSSATFSNAEISPDGKQILYGMQGANDQIWIRDRTTGTREPFTVEGNNSSPVWSPNGDSVAYRSSNQGRGIFIEPVDHSTPARKITSDQNPTNFVSWSPSGRFISFGEMAEDGHLLADVLDLKNGSVRAISQPGAIVSSPVISPDENWIAYVSNEAGQAEVYIRKLSDFSGKQRVSVGGGSRPKWNSNGRELFYTSTTSMVSASVNLNESNEINREILFDLEVLKGALISFEYDSESENFLIVVRDIHDPIGSINVVVNWTEELKQLVPNSE